MKEPIYVPELSDFKGSLVDLQALLTAQIKQHGAMAVLSFEAGYNNIAAFIYPAEA